jgi:hypothetical protein
MENELWKEFLNISPSQRELLNTYLELRQHFQKIGFKESDLESPPYYTREMFQLYDRFNNEKNSLFNHLISYGFDVSGKDFINHLTPLLQKINELTPLKNGNN